MGQVSRNYWATVGLKSGGNERDKVRRNDGIATRSAIDPPQSQVNPLTCNRKPQRNTIVATCVYSNTTDVFLS